MSKKISTIFLSLFLIGILSVSCSNSDKTGAGDGSTTTKGIEQYSGNIYVSTQTFDLSNIEIFGEKYKNAYVWVSVNNDMIAVFPNYNNTTAPNFSGNYMSGITGYGTDYNISSSYNDQPNAIKGTLKFSDTSVTVRFTENPGAPAEFLNKDIVCNIKE